MAKCLTALLVMAVAVSVQGLPSLSDDISAAAAAGNWDQFSKLLNSGFEKTNAELWKQISSTNVKELRPLPGGQVYGQSEYSYHTSSNVNGQKTEQSGGHKIINENGIVKEYDLQPKLPLL